MPRPRKPYCDWKSAELKEVLDEPPAQEGPRLDFKRDCDLLHKDPKRKKQARRDLLVDIAAMANGSGGALLLGVEQSRRRDDPPVAAATPGLPKAEIEQLKNAILGLTGDHLDARPASLGLWTVPLGDDPEKAVLIVEVPHNAFSLSMVTFGQRNQFWVRRAWENKLMTRTEIQYAFDRVVTVREKAEASLKTIRYELMPYPPVPNCWFAAVPIDRTADHVPVDPPGVHHVVASWKPDLIPGCVAERCNLGPSWFTGSLLPSLHGLRCDGGLNEDLTEIRRDGTTILATSLKALSAIPVLHPYLVWASGLCITSALRDAFGVCPSVLAAVGFIGCAQTGFDAWPGRFPESDPSFSPILIDETLDIRIAFTKWATQLANMMGRTDPVPFENWVLDT